MNVNLKNWSGTIFIALVAGFVIFSLLQGQDFLKDFLESEPIDANLERGDILEQLSSTSPILTPTKASVSLKTKVLSPTPTQEAKVSAFSVSPTPAPTLTPSPVGGFSPTPSPTPSLTVSPVYTPTPTLSPTPSPTPSPTFEPSPTPFETTQSQKININTADLNELDKITGVGPVIGQRIIDYRNSYGPFQKIEDIKNVNGIGDVNFEKMKDEITVGY